MNFPPDDFSLYLKYITPPVIGAFIGYLTNRIAIKMLFRPLKTWKIFGIRVPMTPGVIPAKRGELAKNMGEVVGDHLLTSEEIAKGLSEDEFQKHLLTLIKRRQLKLLQKDLGSISAMVPMKYRAYFDIAGKTISYRIKEEIKGFLQSAKSREKLNAVLDEYLETFLSMEIRTLFNSAGYEISHETVVINVEKLLSSRAMTIWFEGFMHDTVYKILKENKSLGDILPDSVQELLLRAIDKQTPELLAKLALIVSEDDVRETIVDGACNGVEIFIDSLGSMSDMVRGFLPSQMIETKIREYLIAKNDDIIAWLNSKDVQDKFRQILRNSGENFMQRPLVTMVGVEDEEKISLICCQCAEQIFDFIRTEEVCEAVATMIESAVTDGFDSKSISLRRAMVAVIDNHGLVSAKKWLRNEIVKLIYSRRTLQTIDEIINYFLSNLLSRKIGPLNSLIPTGVQDGISVKLQEMTSNMLSAEVPGLVQSLNIKHIVVEKLNSLDILRLEGLLLSIMEEQFKYINLFGALLGFLLGCLNLLFFYSG